MESEEKERANLQSKIDDIVLYAMLKAAEADDYRDHSLGQIHLLKYLYLADLEYAQENDGETFSGIEWQFYNFGPWSNLALGSIIEATKNPQITTLRISMGYGTDDFFRYEAHPNPKELSQIANRIPGEVKFALDKYVPEFAADTSSLLHFVYDTYPMLRAKPNETLNFNNPPPLPHFAQPFDPCVGLSDVQVKERNQRLRKFRKQLAVDLKALLSKEKEDEKKSDEMLLKPKYDEIYYDGMAKACEPETGYIEIESGVVVFTEENWEDRENNAW